ncbi:MAG: type II secretion system protein, partial [Candidatus Andersenbacteria bacterium]
MTQRGVTVIEMLVVIAITSLIVIALAVLFGRGIGSYRTQFQQVLTTEDARVQLERISDAVRNARDAGANRWLLIGEPNQLQITTNIDADPAAETVRYFVEDSNLRRGVIDDDGGEETIVTLARSLRNTSQGQDLFAYYDRDGNALSGSVTPDNVARIGLTMLFDADENNEPGIATITTTILPRQQAAGLVNGALLPTRLNYPIGDPLEHTTVAVSVTDGEGAETTELIDMTVLNDGQLVTYQNSHPIHINYQTITVDDDPPGWYAWIGPILVGRVGSQGYYQIDKMTVQELCQGQDLAAILASCETRTLSQGSLTYQYKPVVVYQPGGQRGYMGDLYFENIDEADP